MKYQEFFSAENLLSHRIVLSYREGRESAYLIHPWDTCLVVDIEALVLIGATVVPAIVIAIVFIMMVEF